MSRNQRQQTSNHSHSVRNPLLIPIHDPELSILRLRRRCAQTHDITTRLCLRDREADVFLAGEDLGDDPRAELVGAEVQNWGKADDGAAIEAVTVPTREAADDFLRDDELEERGVSPFPVLSLYMCIRTSWK
jgi:hypothetical protein